MLVPLEKIRAGAGANFNQKSIKIDYPKIDAFLLYFKEYYFLSGLFKTELFLP